MAANQTGNEQPIIIKRKKASHGGHHGGAWKVAYADFVTAMMAFFLLLWLLNVTTSDQRKGIADYFSPVSVSREASGSGGLLGGQTLTVPGAQISPSSPMSADTPVSGPPGMSGRESDDADMMAEDAPMGTTQMGNNAGPSDQSNDDPAAENAANGANTGPGGANQGMEVTSLFDARPNESRREHQNRLDEAAKHLGIPPQRPGERLSDFAERIREAGEKLIEAQVEARQFQEAATEIRQAIQSVPELEPLADNLMIDQTPDGLRIQIVDQDRVSMFPAGSGQMYPATRQLVMQVATALAKLPNKLSISGHTDSKPFAASSNRDNWDLSAERANATRRALMAGGIPENRVQDVIGRADRDLLVPDEPNNPRNRRISMVLLRDTPGSGQAATATP